MKKTFFLQLLAIIIGSFSVSAQNPYLPLWEHIPDGEPYVYKES